MRKSKSIGKRSSKTRSEKRRIAGLGGILPQQGLELVADYTSAPGVKAKWRIKTRSSTTSTPSSHQAVVLKDGVFTPTGFTLTPPASKSYASSATMERPNKKTNLDAILDEAEKTYLESRSVRNQEHYASLGSEPMAYIVANKMSFLEGNIIKYVSRYKLKGGKQDLLKAQVYLEKLIEVTK